MRKLYRRSYSSRRPDPRDPKGTKTTTAALYRNLLVGVFFFVVLCYITAQQFRLGTSTATSFARSLQAFEAITKNDFYAAPTKNTTVDSSSATTTAASMPKTLVIYFPQYHRDPVNDRNWGDNFTDWDSLRSVTKNRFDKKIPRPLTKETATAEVASLLKSNNSSNNAIDDLPPPLGWYDLTEKEPRQTHGILAKKYDIDGFIYHHYWFYDRDDPGPTLAKPLERMLEDGHPDLPFLLNWCAVRWVNVWMGRAIFQKIPTSKNRAITLQNQYFNVTQEEIYQHYLWLKPFFHHPNYIRVAGQPAFMLYSYDARALPILESLRRFAIQDGLEGLHFIVGRSSHPEYLYDTSHLPTDDAMLHQLHKVRQPLNKVDPTQSKSKARSIYTLDSLSSPLIPEGKIEELTWNYNPFNQSFTYPYPLSVINKPFQIPDWCTKPLSMTRRTNALSTMNSTNQLPPNHTHWGHPEITGVITTFDNTPRRKIKSSTVWMMHEDPDDAIERFSKSYRSALYYQKCCVSSTPTADAAADSSGPASVGKSHIINDKSNSKNNRFVVINAWNEWAEGMSIEPSDVYGYRWLETIQTVQKRVKDEPCAWEQ